MGKKRFTDVDKWRDPWFMELPIEMKLLWLFLCDNCDNAGVWTANKRLAEIQIGAGVDWSLAVNLFEGRVNLLENGQKWHLRKFVAFQYPNGLNPKSPPQAAVIGQLRAHGLPADVYPTDTQGVGSVRVGTTHKEEDKETDHSPSSWKGSAEGKPSAAENRERLAKFLRRMRLASNADSIEEILGLAREVGCKGIEQVTDMIEWSVERAREKPGSDVRFARHFEREAKQWMKMKQETERIEKKESA